MFEKMRQFLVKNVNIWKIACMSPALFLLSLAYQRKIMQIFSDINRNVIFICAFIKSKTKETETNSRFSQTVALELNFNKARLFEKHIRFFNKNYDGLSVFGNLKKIKLGFPWC